MRKLKPLDIEYDWDEQSLLVQALLGDDWRVDGTYRLVDGQYALTDLRVRPHGEPHALESTLLRDIRISDLRGALRQLAPSLRGSGSLGMSDELRAVVERIVGLARQSLRREPLADIDYARWASEYVRLVREGRPRPRADLAKQRRMSTDQVRKILERCRQRGLLTSAGRGSTGGDLTDKAVELLRGTA